MTVLYDRRINVQVAGLEITEPRITVEIDRSVDPSQDRGRCDIYNLSPEHEERIYERRPIEISAGYPQTLASIFSGVVQRVIRVRDRLAHITRIDLGDQVRAPEVIGGIVAANHISYEGAVSVEAIVTDLAQDVGLPLGPTDAIPADAEITNWYRSGNAWAALVTLLRTIECSPFEADGLDSN